MSPSSPVRFAQKQPRLLVATLAADQGYRVEVWRLANLVVIFGYTGIASTYSLENFALPV